MALKVNGGTCSSLSVGSWTINCCWGAALSFRHTTHLDMWWPTNELPFTIQKPDERISACVLDLPWCPDRSWKCRITKSVRWAFFGSKIGCLTAYDRLAWGSLPPTLRTPSPSRIGLRRCTGLILFTDLPMLAFLSSMWDSFARASISLENSWYCTALINNNSALWRSFTLSVTNLEG